MFLKKWEMQKKNWSINFKHGLFFFGDFCITLNNENFKYPYQFNVNKSRSEQICNYLDCLLMMMIMIQGMI